MPSSNAATDPTLIQSAQNLGLALTAREAEALGQYLTLLQRWNGVYNLTSVRDPDDMLTLHLLDCLALVGPLRREFESRGLLAPRVLDVGSGAGLPGAVIAMLNTSVQVTCVDAVGKKAAFVRQVSAELRLQNLKSEHARVEQLAAAPFDVITSRAFASLPDFVTLTRRHLAPAGCWLAMKGKRPDDEISQLPGDVTVFHVEQLRIPGLDAERCLVWMRPSQ